MTTCQRKSPFCFRLLDDLWVWTSWRVIIFLLYRSRYEMNTLNMNSFTYSNDPYRIQDIVNVRPALAGKDSWRTARYHRLGIRIRNETGEESSCQIVLFTVERMRRTRKVSLKWRRCIHPREYCREKSLWRAPVYRQCPSYMAAQDSTLSSLKYYSAFNKRRYASLLHNRLCFMRFGRSSMSILWFRMLDTLYALQSDRISTGYTHRNNANIRRFSLM